MKFVKIEKVVFTESELKVWNDMRDLLFSLEDEAEDEELAGDAFSIRQTMDFFVHDHLD